MSWFDKCLVYLQYYFDTMVHFIRYDLQSATIGWVVDKIGFNPFAYFAILIIIYFLGIQDILYDPNRSWKQKLVMIFVLFVSLFLFLFFVLIYRIAFG